MSNEQRTVTCILRERIDASNAAEVEEELMEKLGGEFPQKLILDASNLEYISSGGLRVLLKIQKKVPDTSMIGVCQSVYTVMDMTGFTSLLKVKRAVREISKEGLKHIGAGSVGSIWRIDDEKIVKLFAAGRPLESVEKDLQNSRKALECGVSTCIAFEVVKCGESYGIVYELINSNTLQQLLVENPDDHDLIRRYATLVKDSNKIPFVHDASSGPTFKYELLSIVDRMKDVFFNEEELAVARKLLTDLMDFGTFIHGDCHPGNIMVQGDELLFIDMTSADSGDPMLDISSPATACHVLCAVLGGEEYKTRFGISGEAADRIWDEFLHCYYEGESAEAIALKKRQAEKLGALKLLCTAFQIRDLFSDEGIEVLRRIVLDQVL